MNDNSTESLNDLLLRLDACEDSREWGNTQPDLRTAWLTCQRADWMLWLAATLLPREIVVPSACDCAETTVPFILDSGQQMTALLSLHIAREWAEGREDNKTVRAAADAAFYLSATAPVATAVDLADVFSVVAARVAAHASYAVAHAAHATAVCAAICDRRVALARMVTDLVRNTAYVAQKDAAFARMADLVRARIPADMICEGSSASFNKALTGLS